MPHCQICLCEDVRPLRRIRSPYTSQLYTLYSCPRCRSRVFDISEHPGLELDKFYEVRSRHQKGLKEPFSHSRYWAGERRAIEEVHGGPIRSLLDVGCRTGDFLLHWPIETSRVGVEVSPSSAAAARERGLDVRTDFLENVDFSRPFDVVTCYAILEHLPEPRLFLERLADLVAEGGVLAILIPSFQTVKARLLDLVRYRWHMYEPPEHLSLYSREFLDSHLAERGFALKRCRYTSGGMFNPVRQIPIAGGAFSRLMAVVDRRSPLNRLPVFDHMYRYYRRDH